MWNPGSIPFRRQSYNLNLAGLRRGLASPFAGLGETPVHASRSTAGHHCCQQGFG